MSKKEWISMNVRTPLLGVPIWFKLADGLIEIGTYAPVSVNKNVFYALRVDELEVISSAVVQAWKEVEWPLR